MKLTCCLAVAAIVLWVLWAGAAWLVSVLERPRRVARKQRRLTPRFPRKP